MSNSESSEPHIFFDGSDKSEAMSCYREALNAGAKNLAMTVTGLTAGHFLAKKYSPWYVSKIDFRMRMVFGAFISIVSFNYPAENTMIACNRRNAMRRAETVKQMREAAAAAKAASQGN